MFTSNCDLTICNPSEVYFTEFVPDPVALPETCFTGSKLLWQTRNHWSYLDLQFAWDSADANLAKLSTFQDYYIGDKRNYKLRVEFPTAWAQTYMGYLSTDPYVLHNYPCRITGTFTQSSSQLLRCDLYTNKNPNWVEVSGFRTADLFSLSSNPNIRIQVPRIKLKSVTSPISITATFKFMEETPGMNDPEVLLYQQTVQLGVIDTTSIGTRPPRPQPQPQPRPQPQPHRNPSHSHNRGHNREPTYEISRAAFLLAGQIF